MARLRTVTTEPRRTADVRVPVAGSSRVEATVLARHVRRLRGLLTADLQQRSATYWVGRLGMTGQLADQVLQAHAEAE